MNWKSILITGIAMVLAFFLFPYILPVLLVLAALVWLYSVYQKYRFRKAVKEAEKNKNKNVIDAEYREIDGTED